jgi:hypothetical protein
MSTDVTMQDLELETAELLPSRETLWSGSCGCHGGGTTTVVAGNGDHDGNGDGDGFLNILSGDGDGDLDGNTLVINL